jgi:diaminohydroxyphosphoribosylaminopyrimidine deaminase / 5-amino-6-(5-phosphoribosylamino)uracil reductase
MLNPPLNFTATDYAMMARALQIAEGGRYVAKPNPHVGCVITKHGKIIGEGFTQAGGRPHAEAVALAQARAAGHDCGGATVYTTLEPCVQHATSRGDACSDLLLEARISRVCSALHDPFHGVDGRGHHNLTSAGIKVECGLMGDQAAAQLQAFLSRASRNRPWVRLKVAASLDGRTALANGESKWITGEAARRDVHLLRAEACAVLTGVGTVLADNPTLTHRNLPATAVNAHRAPQPLRVVLDTNLRTPLDAAICQGGNTLIYTTLAQLASAKAAQLQALGVQLQAVPEITVRPNSPPMLDLQVVMHDLAQRRINLVLVEAGAILNAAVLQAGLVDDLVAYLAPTLMGSGARGMFALTPLHSMADITNLKITETRMIGRDWRIHAVVSPMKKAS